MKIKARLALLFAAGTALLVGVGGAVFVHLMWIGLDDGLLSGLQGRAAAIEQSLRSPGGAADLINRGSPSDVDEITQILVRRDGRLQDLVTGSTRVVLDRAEWERARRGPTELEEAMGNSDSPVLIWTLPSAADGGSVVTVGDSTDTVDSATDKVEAALFIGGPIGVLLAGAAAWLIAGAALGPVERMRRQAAHISSGGAHSRLDVPATRDEIAALGQTLNEMLQRVRAAADRQSAFVSSAGHELRTPLANLKLELELATRPGRTRAELVRAVDAAAEEVDRLGRLAEDLLLLASRDEGQLEVLRRPADLVAVVNTSIEAFRSLATRRGVVLSGRLPGVAMAYIDPDRLRQVMDNLLDNALRFAPRDTVVHVALESTEATLVLSVSDDGPGFPAEFLARAFERFSLTSDSRTRSQAGGAGLGLSIVKAIVEAHGGSVEAANLGAGGACVSIRLPAESSPPAPARSAGRVESTELVP